MAEKDCISREDHLAEILQALLRIEAVLRYKPERQWRSWECSLMNRLDARYWACECGYVAPYGPVIFAGCEKHG